MTAQQSLDIVIVLDLIKHLHDDIFCSKNVHFAYDSDKRSDSVFLNNPHLFKFEDPQQIPGIIFGRMENISIPCHLWSGKMDLGIVLHDDCIVFTCSLFDYGVYQQIHDKLKDGYQYDLIHRTEGSWTMFGYTVSLHDQDYKNKHLLFLKRLINIVQQMGFRP